MVGFSAAAKILSSPQYLESKRFDHKPRFQNHQVIQQVYSNFSEMVFGFPEDCDSDGFSATSYSSSSNDGGDYQENEEYLDDEKESENNRIFWKKQHQLLQVIN